MGGHNLVSDLNLTGCIRRPGERGRPDHHMFNSITKQPQPPSGRIAGRSASQGGIGRIIEPLGESGKFGRQIRIGEIPVNHCTREIGGELSIAE